MEQCVIHVANNLSMVSDGNVENARTTTCAPFAIMGTNIT